MNRRDFTALGLAAAASPIWASPALAQLEALPWPDRRLVEQAAAYLQGLKMAKGRFTQTSSRGAASAGAFYMSRPGKARFEYDPQFALLVVSDGRNVSVYDRRLKTFDRSPLGATPLGIFLGRRINFSQDVKVTRLTRTADGFAIAMVDPRGNVDGGLVLEFSNAPIALAGWTVLDGQGVETKVRLVDFSAVDSLDPALFVLADPRKTAG
ncbi:MAG TPA: outer membrane lipoprotein carrier protein LolA [Caulobacteraceae bacterium]|jgi:outer membrane lipoprotein-sorting protein|nr:outer membrane lipoprotein carrier protein LolA [Caulobacteraceae bacterium]